MQPFTRSSDCGVDVCTIIRRAHRLGRTSLCRFNELPETIGDLGYRYVLRAERIENGLQAGKIKMLGLCNRRCNERDQI